MTYSLKVDWYRPRIAAVHAALAGRPALSRAMGLAALLDPLYAANMTEYGITLKLDLSRRQLDNLQTALGERADELAAHMLAARDNAGGPDYFDLAAEQTQVAAAAADIRGYRALAEDR